MKIKLIAQQLLLYFFIFLFGNQSFGQNHFAIPYSGNSLKLQNKKDLHLSMGGMLESYRGLDKIDQQIQVGYAPLDYLGITVFHSRIKTKPRREVEPIIHNSQHTGIEVGTFYKKNFNYRLNWRNSKRSLKRRGLLGSFYVGYANGKLHNNYFNLDFFPEKMEGEVDMNFHKLYLHTGIHWIGRMLEWSGSVKTGKVNFYKGVINGREFGFDFNKISAIIENNVYTFRDYTLKVEINMTNFGIYGQFTSSKIKSLSFDRSDIISGDVGVVFYIDKIKKKIANRKL